MRISARKARGSPMQRDESVTVANYLGVLSNAGGQPRRWCRVATDHSIVVPPFASGGAAGSYVQSQFER